VKRLAQLRAKLESRFDESSPHGAFQASLWLRLGDALFSGDRTPLESVRLERNSGGESLRRPDGGLLLRRCGSSRSDVRLLERLGFLAASGAIDRAGLLKKLSLLLRTPTEAEFNHRGSRSQLQSFEESFFGRLSYHCFREGLEGSFHPRVDAETGEFLLSFRPQGAEPLFELSVPRTQVQRTMALLHEVFPHQEDLAVRPIPLRSIFMVSAKTELDLEVRPAIEAMQSEGERRYLDRVDLEKYRYGELVFVPELGVLAELERPGRERKFRAPVAMTLRRSEIGAFLSEHRWEVEEGAVVLKEAMRPLTVLREPDSVSIESDAIDRSWYYLSVRYGFGGASISLADVLLVAPTTVISHWRDKLGAHAPDLSVVLHHGAGRGLGEAFDAADVVVTSYGVLRNDAGFLGEREFDVAVFDEIQHLKNAETRAHRSAAAIRARVKLGLTGTPVENSVSDLKALFDLVLPGYLGSRADFDRSYVERAEAGLRDLRRLTAPFTLRRLKSDVLSELPEKIEDVRTCALSEDQVTLYREAIDARAAPLVERLRARGERPPYLHVFALLTLLKRICDHPALALGRLDEHARYASGKWDLFQELLQESLDSGKKVVVFTQFLGMIDLFERHLSSRGISFVSLTGASRDRGEIVRSFNEEEDVRVFLGSLKAGGTGIDLTSASVVIHYDRWWNAAREDQATDRVYRLGQNKAVSVLKLTTEGTLEEKISAIIESKRRLMEDVVQVDDPRERKVFTREELIHLLEPV
jgi:superfamily II DNA or RNA helicase